MAVARSAILIRPVCWPRTMEHMHKITSSQGEALFDAAATRRAEHKAQSALPPHTLMQRAGLSVARLAMAICPHARCIWIACGPGNNGGDGFEAARHLHRWGQKSGLTVVVTWTGVCCAGHGRVQALPPDAQAAYDAAIAAGVQVVTQPPAHFDLGIDALLGLGACYDPSRSGSALMVQWLKVMHSAEVPLLAVDLPTWLNTDTGTCPYFVTPKSIASKAVKTGTTTRFTLSLLTLKPGLFTASGRDVAGEVWFDDLGICLSGEQPSAWLLGRDLVPKARTGAQHASHKGNFGDVAVIGGESTPDSHMVGAVLLAARAALHAGAGRVWVSLLTASPDRRSESDTHEAVPSSTLHVDTLQPELMFRRFDAVDITHQVVVAGGGGGQAIRAVLPQLLAQAAQLVLDADALNAIAEDPQLRTALGERSRAARTDGLTAQTILTPHPLEAARLLGITTPEVQADRLVAAQSMAERFGAVVVLKGSGTVIAAPGELPCVNATGNALLATAGTGDVLAGMVGAYLANGLSPQQAACGAVFAHGQLADRWSEKTSEPMTASMLAVQQSPR